MKYQTKEENLSLPIQVLYMINRNTFSTSQRKDFVQHLEIIVSWNYHLKLKTEPILINNRKEWCLDVFVPHSAFQIILLVGISYSESGQLHSATEFGLPLFLLCVL